MESQRRAKNVAISGAVLQTVLSAVMLALWLALQRASASALACLFFLAGAALLWLMTAVLFYCRQLQRREERELEEIAATATTAIFEQEAGLLRPAEARLAWMERWIAPAFTLLWAAYNAGAAVFVFRHLLSGQAQELSSGTAQGALFAILMAFVAFLFSRYALGMGSRAEWRLLRAAGSYLYVNMLAMAAVAASLLAANQGYFRVDWAVAYAIPGMQLVLAAELLLNFVLDLYRPRIPGQEYHGGFESRLFNLIAEPAAIGHSIAEAVNYQFGFEVSKTWFYQLVSRAFVPLVVLAAAVLVAMTSLVIVEDGQQGVVLHWGRPQTPLLGPGLHVKWPWPIDTARRFDVATIHEILLGVGSQRDPNELRGAVAKEGTFQGREFYLWTAEHGARQELDFLLAAPPDRTTPPAGREDRRIPPVNVIKLVLSVRYVITDVLKYGYGVTDAAKLLEYEAGRQMVRYCASATLDSPVGDGETDRPEAIMTYGRRRAADELKRRIQAAADDADLGVEIISVELQAVHPPASAAGAFQDVLKAERHQDQMRYEAEAEANRVLARVAGDPAAALRLALAIRTSEELETLLHLQDGGQEFDKALEEYVRSANRDCQSLKEEIQRERLLGESAGAKDELLKANLQHLATLASLADPAMRRKLPELLESSRRAASELFDQATGQPAAIVAQAGAYRWTKELTEQSRAEAFHKELLAYQASPRIYMLDRWLDVWDQVLPRITKYVLGVDAKKIELWLNLEREAGVMEGSFEPQKASGGK
jgi:regulator of protease activity HflC (stomatin/prohibitin superfamily)